MNAGPLPPVHPVEKPSMRARGQRRRLVLVQLEAALAAERAGIDGVLEQRAAELLQGAAAHAANGADTDPSR